MSACIDVLLNDAAWKKILRPYCKTVRAVCTETLLHTPLKKRVGDCEITVVLADDAFIRPLNKQWMGKDKPTNVLSFPSGEEHFLGDIVLARETLEREAEEQGKTLRDHATHLLVHGTLHLLGHDHMRPKEAQVMEALEIKILKKLGVGNPYL